VVFQNDNAGVGNGVGTGSYADVVGNPNAITGSKFIPNVSAPLLYNPDAFAAPTGLTFGNSGRNLLRNPNRTNFDMALFKHIPVKEYLNLEFRAEAFNVFNHTQFYLTGPAGSNNVLGDPAFLTPAGAHSGRILQLAVKAIF
jgi:hypothetical protein